MKRCGLIWKKIFDSPERAYSCSLIGGFPASVQRSLFFLEKTVLSVACGVANPLFFWQNRQNRTFLIRLTDNG
jgi:hypothetical protein